MTPSSLLALLEGLIDYAGLFPPAALSMDEAIRNYARYREGACAWALGRFVVPAERVHEVPPQFPLSILGLSVKRDGAVHEVKAGDAAAVEAIAREAAGRMVYVEINDRALLPVIAQFGLRAKIRTGGVTPEAFPAIGDVAAFLRACARAGVAFKATAGLHHPLRCLRPLTYAADAPRGTMHGFVNVFLAAAMPEHAEAILAETDAAAFHFEDQGADWRDHRVTTAALRRLRAGFATSFGSCSFEEPIEDLQRLGWLA